MNSTRAKNHATNEKQTEVQPPTELGDVDWKSIGNQHYNSNRFNDAVDAYTKGIKKGGNISTLQANRSAAYLALSKYKLALKDAETVLTIEKNHIKCIFRKATALFGMKLYRDAIAFLETINMTFMPREDIQTIADLIVKGKSFVSQSVNGDFPWHALYRTQSKYHNMADYTSSVIVKEAPMKGRGLFATKNIKPGELILPSKAFAYLEDNVPCPSPSHTVFLEAEINMQLSLKIVKVLEENPEKCLDLYRLYAGPNLNHIELDEKVPKGFRIDKNRIDSISKYNRFSSINIVDDGTMMRNSGIWIIPSYLNHSCVDANTTWFNIGDFMFVRAAHSISEGEEILITYQAPNGLIAQKELDMYDFICSCRLCKRDSIDNASVKAKRSTILSQLETIVEKYNTQIDHRIQKEVDKEILRLIKLFQQTRTDAPELNCCLVNQLLTFGFARINYSDFIKAANTFENVYELIKNIPAFFLQSIDACIQIIIAYATVRSMSKAKYWFRVLKKQLTMAYGTDKVLDLKYETYAKIMRDNGLHV